MKIGLSGPRLPVELTDLIIDNVRDQLFASHQSQLELQRSKVLSALALVCYGFCKSVYKHRFSQVWLDVAPYGSEEHVRLLNFHSLIHDKVWTEKLIARSVRGIHVNLLANYSTFSVEENKHVFWDPTITYILKRLFMEDDSKDVHPKWSPKFEFSLLGHSADLTDWETLHPSFVDGINKLCSSANMTTLRLYGFKNIPLSLFSNVRRLVLRHSELAPMKIEHNTIQYQPQGGADCSPLRTLSDLVELDANHNSFISFITQSALQPFQPHAPYLTGLKSIVISLNDPESQRNFFVEVTDLEMVKFNIGAHPSPEEPKLAIGDVKNLFGHRKTPLLHTLCIDYYRRCRYNDASPGDEIVRILDIIGRTTYDQLRNLKLNVYLHDLAPSDSGVDAINGSGLHEVVQFLVEKEDLTKRLRSIKVFFSAAAAYVWPESSNVICKKPAVKREPFERKAEETMAAEFSSLTKKSPNLDTEFVMLDKRGCRFIINENMFM